MTLTPLTIPYLGPRPDPAGSYFRRSSPPEPTRQTLDSDLLKSIKKVVHPSKPRQARHSLVYPCNSVPHQVEPGVEEELAWNNNTVVHSMGGVIRQKWSFESEGQDIQWVCRGFLEGPGSVVEGGSSAAASTNEAEFISPSPSTFSRFAQNAQARQRAMTPSQCLRAVFIFLRNLGKIYVASGEEYTFHIPFLVRRAWPLHPHGVLIQREVGEYEIRDAARMGISILPTLFSLHDPFSEPKVVGVTSRIRGTPDPSVVSPVIDTTQFDSQHPLEAATLEDSSVAGDHQSNPTHATQTEALPPKPERPRLSRPPPTDRVLWVSEEVTNAPLIHSFVVTCTLPLQQSLPGPTQTPSDTPHPTTRPYANKMHLSLWHYTYSKPREVPDPITTRRKRATDTPHVSRSKAEPTPPPVSEHRDPEALRRRELQDRADRVAPPSPVENAPQAGGFPQSLPPRQPLAVGAQPTLASLPGGEVPASWGHPQTEPGIRRRQPSLSVTMDRMALGAGNGIPEEAVTEGGSADRETTITFMNAGHMKMQPSVWLEKIATIPMSYDDMRHPGKISIHLFDSRSEERSLLAIHFPAVQLLSIYTLTRVQAERTLRLSPAVHVPALSATPVAAFRASFLDLLIVKPDNTLTVLTHGIRMVDVQLAPHTIPSRRFRVSSPGLFNADAEDAMSVDESTSAAIVTDNDGNSDTSMRSMIDKAKIVRVSESIHHAATIHFEDGSTTRAKFAFTPRDKLTCQCFWALSYALTGPRAFALQRSWLSKWNAAGGGDTDGEEFTCFVEALCELVDITPPHKLATEGHKEVIPGSWNALAFSASHDRLENDPVFKFLDSPFRACRAQLQTPARKPHEDIAPCLLALHTLGECYKLRTDNALANLPRLAPLLISLGRAARPEWADHWVRLFPDVIEGWADPKRDDSCTDPRLRPQPPDIYNYLFTRLLETDGKPNWMPLIHISQMFQFEPSMEYGRTDPIKDLYRLSHVWECFVDPNVPTARKRAENAMQLMVRLGMTNDELDAMPYGIAQPIREALRTCQSLPGDWSVQAYNLILRPDLAQMMSGHSIHIASRDNFRQVNRHIDPSISRKAVGELVDESRAAMSPEPPHISGVELDLGDFTEIRFGSDRRLQEVARMLQSSSPAVVKMPERHDLTEHEVAKEQQVTALRVAERTLALPVGRAMFTFGSIPTVTRDASQIPKMEFSVRLEPYNALVAVDVTKMNAEAKNWADFHNGVATSLRISPSSRMVDSSWITFNKPTELTAQHAGFLFGLGLSGHLKNMMTWHTFSYLTPKHDLTSIGVLLGLSAAHVGTANRHVTKLLAVHTPALLPNPSVDLNVPMLTQAAGLVGIGLLYMGTKHRPMAEVALHEIGRTQVTSADQTTDHREAYSLSAALAFGMIMLSAGPSTSSPADMSMVSRLRLLIHGEPVLVGNRTNKPTFDVTLTSAPATLALALMFLKTGREDIADILAIPNTLLELHHLQPSFLLVRTLCRALIMWDRIVATPQWVTDQLPKSALEALEKRMAGREIDESQELAYFNIVSGACFAIGLKYASTAQEEPYSCLLHFHDLFTRISNQNSGQFDHRIKRAAVRDGLNLMSLALAMVMAGTGEINCLRRFRFSHGQAIQPSKYGVHMATHMAIGLLFLGGGRYTLGTSDSAIVCLLAAFYPRFPSLSHENRGHLQALRHMWVLAVEPRCLIARDVDSKEVVYLPVKVKLKEGAGNHTSQLISPTLFPDIDRLLFIRVDTPRYIPFFLDVANNPRHREALLRNQTLWVKRRTGHLGYAEDPRGSRSIFVRSGASSGDAAVLDNPKASDAKSASTTEFYQFMSSFSNEAFYVAFVDRFCRSDGEDEDELIFSAFSHAAMLECLTLDRPHLFPVYLGVHLTRHAQPESRALYTLAARDLFWLDEFYRNVYDPRFSGRGDQAPIPPLLRRPFVTAAERTMHTRSLSDPDLCEALRLYHRGEGIMLPAPTSSAERDKYTNLLRQLAYHLTRTNIPPSSVLVQMREEAQATHRTMMEALKDQPEEANMIEHAIKGLMWSTGVLFSGGIFRPWSMRAVEEVINDW